jgi:hypothetical protein
MSNHVNHVKSCHSCHFMSIHVNSCHSCHLSLDFSGNSVKSGRVHGGVKYDFLRGPSATASLSGRRQKRHGHTLIWVEIQRGEGSLRGGQGVGVIN